MYCLQHGELVVIEITTDGEIKASITSVDYLVGAKFNEVGLFGITTYDQAVDLLFKLVALICVIVNEILGKPRTPKLVLD